MREVIEKNKDFTQTGIVEDDKFYLETKFNDKKQLDTNENIRVSNLINKAKMGIHEGEDLRAWIRCPDTLQWSMFKAQFPETYSLLKAKTESDRMRGVQQMKILFPEWIVYDRL